MLSRNRELYWLAATYVALTVFLAATAAALGHGEAALWILGSAALLAIPVTVFTRARYRVIAELAEGLDARLHADRPLALNTMREGELAVLASELEKVISRLDLATEQLEAEGTRLSDALADISHQLKTPLTSLSIMTELVRKRVVEHGGTLTAADIADINERLRIVERLQDRVQWLVSSLLKLARLDAGSVQLVRQRVDTTSLIREAAAPLAVSFDLADVTLAVDAQADAGFKGDPSWIAEALGNVLKNCMEHAPAGGHVRVRATEDALACRIRVEDDGPGIAADDLPHIFERFYRGGKETSAGVPTHSSEVNPAGVGIGLALAKSLITAQGGTITAGNATDADGHVTGARFDITFFKTAV